MRILAIETSCDETAISILEARGGIKRPNFQILSNIVSSQVKIHAKWGGVVPSLAKREHIKNLPVVLKKALAGAKTKSEKIDAIAVTQGPGLEPALWTGINFAKELSEKWNKPLIPVNHMEGHLYSVFLQKNREISNLKSQISKIKFPAVALLVSGGHTQLVLAKDWLKYKRLGETRDDAVGEAFDKVARMLNLGYPGGPIISKLALSVGSSTSHKIELPRPMIYSEDYDFSFSGLKTAVLYKLKEFSRLTSSIKSEICHEFQQAVIDVLISKTMRAAKEYKAKTIILGGGVAANKELRKQFAKATLKNDHGYVLKVPEMKFTGDNAAMIALAGYFRYQNKKRPVRSINSGQAIKANGNLKIC